MIVTDVHRAVGLVEERVREAEHVPRCIVTQIAGIEIAYAHAIQRVCIFEQRCEAPVPVRSWKLVAEAVVDDGNFDRLVVMIANAATREQFLQRRQRAEPLDRAPAVHVAHVVVGAREIVEVHGRP